MTRIYFILIVLMLAVAACDEPVVPKPQHLVKESQMIDMLVDIHLAEASYNKFRYDSTMKDNSSVNFYYSVLEKYSVPDTLFERSLVYYASNPKNFDKMYRKVTSRLSEMEQSFSGRKEELLKFDEKADAE
jgi:peptide subunit release factor RF-3